MGIADVEPRMTAFLRRHLSYANVIVTTGFVLAISGVPLVIVGALLLIGVLIGYWQRRPRGNS